MSSWRMGNVPGEVPLAYGRVGEGPEPLVALHGITAQHRAFNAFARHLEYPDGVAALDLRGRGDSGKPPPGNYGLDAHARDVARVLDFLEVESGILVGHSMGAFVALHTALSYPDRVKALVLLDGGWPRPEEDRELDEGVREGLERAYSRLDRVFETSEHYLDFWFPGGGLALEDLPEDLADYYRYDLEEVDGGHKPKASREAAEEDAGSVFSESPTVADMRKIGRPAALARAAEGFFPGTEALIPDEVRDDMAAVLDLSSELLLPGANHYTMLLSAEHARRVAEMVDDFVGRLKDP